MAEALVIDCTKCNGCGLCVNVCANNVLILVDQIITIIEAEHCDWCLLCEDVCASGAIAFPFEIVIQG
ncbi:ferredoxin [Chloroflexota bacterium]